MESSDPALEDAEAFVVARLSQARAVELPILPEVAAAIIAESGESFDFNRVCAGVERDQALAGHVLRIANSAYFAGRAQRVGSLKQALVRLGTERIRELVLAVVMKNRLFRTRRYEGLAQRYWKQAGVAASLGRELGRMLRRNPEQAFLCGLLHTVGKPVVLQILGELESTLGPMPEDGVRHLVEAHHVEAGSRLVNSWSLPPFLGVVVAHQADPETAPAHRELVRIAVAAGALAPGLLDGAPDEELVAHPAIAGLHIYPDEAAALLANRAELLALAEAA